jgi:hypothetical protein
MEPKEAASKSNTSCIHKGSGEILDVTRVESYTTLQSRRGRISGFY